jgi:sortase (surface protein transpeptidase)
MDAGRSVVSAGDAKPVVDSGKIWHWAGTGYVGQGRFNVAAFGHRTGAGGPLYFVGQLTVGDRIYMVTSDQRSYVYKYSRRELTSDSSS